MHILCAVPQRWLSAFSELNKNCEIESNLVTCDEDLPALMHAETTPQPTHGCLWWVMLPFFFLQSSSYIHLSSPVFVLEPTVQDLRTSRQRSLTTSCGWGSSIWSWNCTSLSSILPMRMLRSSCHIPCLSNFFILFSRIDSRCKPGLGRVGVSCKSCVSVSLCVCGRLFER